MSINTSPVSLPPHLALLLHEPFPLNDWGKARKLIREMMQDLRAQAEISYTNWTSFAAADSNTFVAVMDGGLDLFKNEGACSYPECRLSYVEQIARSIALMADQVVMHDFVFEKILLSDARSNASIDSLLADVVVLKVMKPLIEQNLIVFEPPFVAACSHCLAEVESQISSITEQMYSKFRDSMKPGRSKDGRTFIDSGPLYNPPLYFYPGTTRGNPIRQLVEQCVRAAILDVASAAHTGGAIFSNSPIGMAAVLASEGRFSGPQGMRALSAQRAGSLPWVRGLSITQTLELRQEAKQALPQLREFLARNLGAIDLTSGGQGTTEAHYIAELREQSEAVKAELRLVTSKRSRLAKNSLGIGILGISALGLATDKIDLSTAALALFGALSSLRAMNSSHEEHTARQKSRPGYVLVAAETILQHAHQ